MNLPFSTPDLEDGFAALTPLKNRPPFAGPSSFSWNQEPIGPPPKGKGKASATQLRDPDDELSDDENITPQKYSNQQAPPLSGYGMHSTQNKGEDVFSRNNQQIPQQNVPQQNIPQQPIYPQPAYLASPKIIKEPGLFYDGENFSKFLRRFERAAQAFQASDYEKALQIGCFMKTEELRDQIEAMDGYIAYDWPKLRKEMIDTWGGLDNTILYTTNDLVKVTEKVAAKGGIKTSRELTAYVTKYTSIMKYLITNGHIHKEEDTSILFMKEFSKESQQNIKRHLVSYDLLPKGPDGSNLPPKWAHLVKVAEMEVRIVEPGYLDVTNTNFSEANQLMQKRLDAQKGDSQRRNQMIADAPSGKMAVDKTIEDMAKEISLWWRERALAKALAELTLHKQAEESGGALVESLAFQGAGKRRKVDRMHKVLKSLLRGIRAPADTGDHSRLRNGGSVYTAEGLQGAGSIEGRKRGSERTRGGSGGGRPAYEQPEEYLDRQASEG
ncbi:uncharacterized protein PGTG_12556 [Puccinia graminis f. sp. tritici CRL 75-36-700-3]|uniref:Uncharacterized protein n=1 Tax=Puccinia graminis f. sp. tritici (strain CRL 75-36-700-3 / race SCCL) TaxID=418459 RepID=E3KV09_PUCGT|nr:uncharacterized protein PGTG_12556 [Puccinia graminis f. sp. tritici CRL 75-36-700-3]EFP88109.2 hypothetical protein PGTG_12556 [Puccinia graminis f. sp. tritici CRL 75-36-700-3]